LPTVQTNNVFLNTQDYYKKTIHENERDYITSVLKKCNGKIWGTGVTAEVLRIPPGTLKSKMKKLGIRKQNIEGKDQ
jgi:transcriptional regulator with GAF, ATPase, and Fis domain